MFLAQQTEGGGRCSVTASANKRNGSPDVWAEPENTQNTIPAGALSRQALTFIGGMCV